MATHWDKEQMLTRFLFDYCNSRRGRAWYASNPINQLGLNQFSHSVVSDSLWPPWTAAYQAFLSITNSWSLLKLRSIESVMPSNHLILCHLLLLLPSIFPSIRVFSNESVLCIRWSKYWSFSFSISPSNEYSGLISFRIDNSQYYFRIGYSWGGGGDELYEV